MDQTLSPSHQNPVSQPPSCGIFDAAFVERYGAPVTVADAKEALFYATGILPSEVILVNEREFAANPDRFTFRSSFCGALEGLYALPLLTQAGVAAWNALTDKFGNVSDVPQASYLGDAEKTRAIAVHAAGFYLRGFRAIKHATAAARLVKVMEFLLRATPVGEIVGDAPRGTWVVATR